LHDGLTLCSAGVAGNMSGVLSLERVVEILSSRLSDLPGFVKAVVLFGSTARGEATETSDIDLLVLHEGLQGLSPVKRRRLLYTLVVERVGSVFEAVTVIDMDYSEFTKPEQVTPFIRERLLIVFDVCLQPPSGSSRSPPTPSPPFESGSRKSAVTTLCL